MNFIEGMRRLALLVGLIGATLGAFASYVNLRQAIGARGRYELFERLKGSEVVQQEHDSRGFARLAPEQQIERLKSLPVEKQREMLAWLTVEAQQRIWEKLKGSAARTAIPTIDEWIDYEVARPHQEWYTKQNPKDGKWYTIRAPSQEQANAEFDTAWNVGAPAVLLLCSVCSESNKGGIRTIHWTNELSIESIETQDGSRLYPMRPPSIRPYLLAAVFPVVGFCIPWGFFFAVRWVGIGFLEASK